MFIKIAKMEEFVKLGGLLGLEGTELRDFVELKLEEEKEEKTRREIEERDERARDRELRKLELEHEIEMKRMEIQAKQQLHVADVPRGLGAAKLPKLPAFVDGKDDIDSYLRRFERFAATNKWDKPSWATNLSALLTGKALDVYSRLSDIDAIDYDQLKESLLKRYNLTEEGFRVKFREGKPEAGESPEQFIVRLKNNLNRWIELAGVSRTYVNLADLFVKEQFINACPRDLRVHIQERAPKDLDELSEVADKFLLAHNRELAVSTVRGCGKEDAQTEKTIQCYNCQEYGHKASSCPKGRVKPQPGQGRQCFKCGGFGHEARMCPTRRPQRGGTNSGRNTYRGNGASYREVSGGCLVNDNSSVAEEYANEDEIKSCISEGKVMLSCGKNIPFVNSACVKSAVDVVRNMPVVKGKVGETIVDTLRDTGCSGVVVKRELVKDEQLTGNFSYMMLIDNTVRRVPVAQITVDTPYFKGETEAQCLPDAIYDLIIGNIPDARSPDDPDPLWHEASAVTTRLQAKKCVLKPLGVPETNADAGKEVVTKEKLRSLQLQDQSLDKFRDMHDVKVKGLQEVSFEEKGGILYRVFKHPRVNQGSPLRQVVVPASLRTHIMQVAHDSLLGGHLGKKKTIDRILSNFYWPGLNRDVTTFCKTCDICQKTVPKGTVHRVPLEKMPIIDVPFKRVAVDLVGPIDPPTEGGHRYILTLVDYATRYPEAVPLKKITTESVAEALVNMYTRFGVPEEVLSDMGSQFTSDCMREVSRLLGIRQLTTTPYHPICNGLVEKFNGTLKKMLRRLACDQPKQWNRYVDALLFAYREVPQESTGFSPFELLYGRTVRGPMNILRTLWTKDTDDVEVKNTYEYVFELRNKMEQTLQIAQEELRKSQTRYKHYYDRRSKKRTFQPGDEVLVLLPSNNNKLLMQWKGPYRVDSVVGTNDYRVIMKGKTKTLHANLLKLYSKRQPTPSLDVLAGASGITLEDDCEEDLLELPVFGPKETAQHVKFGDDLPKDVEQKLKDLTHKYSAVFTDIPGTCRLVEHHINLTSDTPVRSKPYPIPYHMREKLKDDIDEMLRLGVIRESDSPYASPVVIVPKKDGTNRVCIDYRKLNRITIFDPTPMVSVEDLLSKLSQKHCFSKIDLTKGYWQIPVAVNDIPKTAFVTPDGSYEFLKMPFGMVNAAATLVRAMRKLLAGLDNTDSYIDDILVHTIDWNAHINTLDKLFQRMAGVTITARPSKTLLGSATIEFLGQRISVGRVSVDAEKLDKVKCAPRPQTKKQLRSFLGLTGYYRNYIPNYAAIAVPLTDLTRKGLPNNIHWGESQEKAYNTLKNALVQKPILRLPDLQKAFTLRTDASDYGIGAVLLQEEDGHLFPVSYASKKLSDRERLYATVEKECFAIVWAVKRFMIYLYGKEFTLQTDHQPLAYLNKSKFTNNRIMRWAMYLQNYKFKIEFIKGVENVGADYLSRIEE